MRKLASVQQISNLQPIIGADKIECATILGWQVIVQKGMFKVGDLCIYIEPDAIIPRKEWSEFLFKDNKTKSKHILKTIKLRGQVSQGLVLPLLSEEYKLGDDVTDVLQIEKNDLQLIEEKLLNAQRKHGRLYKFLRRYIGRRFVFKTLGQSFPSFITKTDEPRIQCMPTVCRDETDTYFQCTEKIDGQSATFFLRKREGILKFFSTFIFGVCSRNIFLTSKSNNNYWKIALHYNIEGRMKKYAKQMKQKGIDIHTFIIQGEIAGPNIQKNKYNFSSLRLFVFNIQINGDKLDNEAIQVLCKELGLEIVPIISNFVKLPPTIPEAIRMTQGTSCLADIPREGLVCRNYNKNISFKIVNVDFLLKYGE